MSDVDADAIMPQLLKASTLEFAFPNGSNLKAGIDDWDAVAKALRDCQRA